MPGTADSGAMAGEKIMGKSSGEGVGRMEHGFRYLATCAKLGRAAQKPASGRLMLRVPPEVHTAALAAAQVSGQSLNQWATQALRRAVE